MIYFESKDFQAEEELIKPTKDRLPESSLDFTFEAFEVALRVTEQIQDSERGEELNEGKY